MCDYPRSNGVEMREYLIPNLTFMKICINWYPAFVVYKTGGLAGSGELRVLSKPMILLTKSAPQWAARGA